MHRLTLRLLPFGLLSFLVIGFDSIATSAPAHAAPPHGALVYVANAPGGGVSGYDPQGVRQARVETKFGVDGGPDGFAVADVDGNGRDDVLVADAQSHNVIEYLGPGLVGIAPGIGYRADSGDDAFAAGDTDGDRAAELVVAHASSGDVRIFSRSGGSPIVQIPADFESGDGLAVGDVDGDGDAEILVARESSGEVAVFDRTSSAPVSTVDTGFGNPIAFPPDAFAAGDVDGDLGVEILVAEESSGKVSAYDWTGGAPVKTVQTSFDSDPSAPDRFGAGDVDGDGIGDLVVANAPAEEVDLYLGNDNTGKLTDTGFDANDALAVGSAAGRDVDGDTIPDQVERFGIHRADGSELLPPSNPCQETINVEIDYSRGVDQHGNPTQFKPDPLAVDLVEQAFAAAPDRPAVAHCPYPGVPTPSGIELNARISEEIPPTGAVGSPAEFDAIRNAHFDAALEPYVHYSPWVDRVVVDGEVFGGYCCYGPTGQDFLGEAEGDVTEQATTFMHELGHALGLGHGGGDGINKKPNYLSVMNYWFSHTGLHRADQTDMAGVPIPKFDFSRQDLPDLNEKELFEDRGIDVDEPYFTQFYEAPGVEHPEIRGDQPIDWSGGNFDGVGGAADDVVPKNLNDDDNGVCVRPRDKDTLTTTAVNDDKRDDKAKAIFAGPNFVCDTPASAEDEQVAAVGVAPPLTGYNDWQNIRFGGCCRSGGALLPDETTSAEAAQLTESWDAAVTPDREVALDAPRPGFDAAVHGIAIDGSRLYATHRYATTTQPPTSDRPGSLVVVDRRSLQVTKRIRVGFSARAVAVNPATNRIYVLSGTDPFDPTKSLVTVIDRTSLAVVAKVTMHTAQATWDIEVNPRTNRVYVSNPSQARIHVIDGATNTELAPILIGRGPMGMAVEQATNTIYVAQSRRDGAGGAPDIAALGSVVDDGHTQTINPPVDLGDPLNQPMDVALDPVNSRLYVANLGGGGVHPNMVAMDSRTRTVIGAVLVPGPARAITVNPYAHQIFVASEGKTAVIDDAKLAVVRTMSAGLAFAVATETGPGRQLYFGDLRSGELTRLSYSSGTPS